MNSPHSPSIQSAADSLAATLPDGGFSLSVHGPLGESLRVERGWPAHAIVPVWSTTKGPAAATLLLLLERAGLDLLTPVAQVWPEFRPAVNFAQLLSHQAGLAAPEGNISVFDHAAAAASLAQQEPNWPLGTAHGYHPRSFGYLLDAISLKLTGERLGAIWNREIAAPLGIDFFIGLTETEFHRVAKVTSGRATARPEEKLFVQAYMDSGSLTRRAFDSFKGLNAPFEFNYRNAWEMASPAFGGIGSADGIAKFYAMLAGDGGGAFSDQVRDWMQTPQCSGMDVILKMPTTFTAGFQKDPLDELGQKLRRHYGPSLSAFGHPGAGGSIGFADPEHGIGVALVLNVLSPGVFPKSEIVNLLNAIYSQ